MTVPVGDMSTPALVNEYVGLKCADARGERTDAARHARLGYVVDELRARRVLD
jgi:hypothetical protein